MSGTSAIGHVRYSTAGESGLKNAQPILIDCAHGEIAVGHNGNLVNAQDLRDRLVIDGSIFQTTSDTEVLLHLYARSKAPTVEQALIEAVTQAQGAFSLVFLTKDRLIAIRDPHGFRPLTLGRLGDAYIVCSETCALDLIDATWVRDVEPGEMLVDRTGRRDSRFIRSIRRRRRTAFSSTCTSRGPTLTCSVRASTRSEPSSDASWRVNQPGPADVIVPIPDSGVCAATGFAEESGTPLRVGLIRNHYVGRTFIEPHQSIRHFGVRVKLNPVRSILQGKRVVLVDDSIVRGTTSRKIVKMVRAAGAYRSPHANQLPADDFAVLLRRGHAATIRAHRCDALASRRSGGTSGPIRWAISASMACWRRWARQRSSYCTSCYTGRYPVAFPRDEAAYLQLALKLVE